MKTKITYTVYAIVLVACLCFWINFYLLAPSSSLHETTNQVLTVEVSSRSTTEGPSRPSTPAYSQLAREPEPVVPNIVHFVWINDHAPLSFHQMLSVKSAYQMIQPERILIHCNMEPEGHWWKHIKATVKTLKILHLTPVSEVFGNEVILPEHMSDVSRLQILMEHGGIYMDFDVIALKPFTELRHYNMTLGLEYHGDPGRLNNGVIVAARDASFLALWYDTYRTFTKREWDLHDCIVPYRLAHQYPHLIHVEECSINYPGGKQLDLIYNRLYDWRTQNYAIHLWHRLHEFEHGPFDIKYMNTTFGEVARLVYYGNSTLFPSIEQRKKVHGK